MVTEVIPSSSRFGVLSVPPSALGTGSSFKTYQDAAATLKIQHVSLQVSRSNPDLENAFEDALKERVGAVITVTNAVFRPHQKRLAELALKKRMPTLRELSDYVSAGCLMSYSTDDVERFRRAATYVNKILKGAMPAELPVERPTKFELVINMKTANKLGLPIPAIVMARADRVIR